MDPTWFSAPWPAFWLDSDGLPARANPAAERLAATLGLAVDELGRWAAAQVDDGATAAVGAIAALDGLRACCVPLTGGVLVWLQTTPEAAMKGVSSGNAALDLVPLPLPARRALDFLDRALVMAGVSVWRVDLKTSRIYFNAVGFQSLGRDQDPLGVDLQAQRSTIHPDDRAAVEQAAQEAIRSGQVVDAVARYRNPDGSWRLLLTRRVAEHDERGQAIGLSGVSLDLTELQLQREQAQTYRDRSHLAAETLGAGFFSREGDDEPVQWDEPMMRLYGRPPEAGPLTRQQWLQEWVHPQDREWLAQRIQAADEQWEAMSELRFRIIDPQGQVRWLQSWTRRIWRDGKRVSYGMHLDVTERHLADTKAQRDDERTRYVLEAANVGVWECDLQGREMMWNDGMYRLRDCRPDDPRTLDQIVADSTDPDVYQELRQKFFRHLSHGEPYRGEVRLRFRDGSTRWLWTEGQTLRDAQGQPVGVAGINLDVTERKRAAQLQEDKLNLERASRARSDFMARMSHELRTPMNAVQGFVRLMAQDAQEPVLSTRQRERLTHIDEASQQMMQLVDDLLQTAGQSAPPLVRQTASPSVPQLKVLCVEDNPVNLQLVRELMALRPSVVLDTAEDGGTGITAALAEPPDLLLLDMHLPDMNGLQVLLRLRAEPSTSRCRIVALSADALPDHISAALAAGFDDYWTKPIQFETFLNHVDRLTLELGRPSVQQPS